MVLALTYDVILHGLRVVGSSVPPLPLRREEAGSENLNPVTARVAQMAGRNTKNANRDVVRYMRLPLDLARVETVVIDELTEEVTPTTLCMVDPHELLDYAWRTGRIPVSKDAILNLDMRLKRCPYMVFEESTYFHTKPTLQQSKEVLGAHGALHHMGC